jgi:integrase/recombinase XerD
VPLRVVLSLLASQRTCHVGLRQALNHSRLHREKNLTYLKIKAPPMISLNDLLNEVLPFPNIIVKPVKHYGEVVAGIFFSNSADCVNAVKKIDHAQFSRSCSCWVVPLKSNLLDEIVLAFKGIANVDVSALKNSYSQDLKLCPVSYHELLVRKRYSPSTAKNYLTQFSLFINHFKELNLDEITDEHIKSYMDFLVSEKKVSSSTQNVVINAIKFYYEQVLKRQQKVYALERPIKETRLPRVLSEDEVKSILIACDNLKHKTMLYLIYSAGLRRSELTNLKVCDIDVDRSVIYVRMGKGKKDRITLLSDRIKSLVKEYQAQYKPTTWLFEGERGEAYSESSLQKVFKRALFKSGVKKEVTLHSLRHSFATHLLENGTDIRYIQALLGHASSKTTEIYAHVTRKGFEKIRSPLDNLDL